MKSTKRKKLAQAKRARKGASYREGKGKSRYARKRKWLAAHGERDFNIPALKPWGS